MLRAVRARTQPSNGIMPFPPIGMRHPESTPYLALGLAGLLGGVALLLWSNSIATAPCVVSGGWCTAWGQWGLLFFAGIMTLLLAAYMLATAFWRRRSSDLSDQMRNMGLDGVTTSENSTPLVDPGLTYLYQRQRPPRT